MLLSGRLRCVRGVPGQITRPVTPTGRALFPGTRMPQLERDITSDVMDALKLVPRSFVLSIHLEQLEIRHDDGKQIIEIVGHATGQLTHGLHFLGLAKLFLGTIMIG